MARRRSTLTRVGLVAAALVLGCDRSPPPGTGPTANVAEVAERPVPWSAVRERLGEPDADAPPVADAARRKRALQSVLEEELILREAEALGVFVTEQELDEALASLLGEVRAEEIGELEAADRVRWRPRLRRRLLIEKTIDREVTAKIDVPAAAIAQVYEAATGPEGDGRFRLPERVLARQIFSKDAGTAERALARLRKGEPFEQVAREMSEAPEAARGGWMGYIDRGTLPEAMETALFELPVGGRCDGVVESPYGYHLFEVVAREAPRDLTLTEARREIRRELLAQAEQEAYRAWIAKLYERYPVTRAEAAP